MPDPSPAFMRFTCPGCQKRFKVPKGKPIPRMCPACARVEAQISGAAPAPLDELLAAVRDEQLGEMSKAAEAADRDVQEEQMRGLATVFKSAEPPPKEAAIAEATQGYILATTIDAGHRPYGEVARVTAGCGMFIGFLLLFLLRQPPSLLVLLPYLGVLLMAISGAVLLSRRVPAVRSKTGKAVTICAAAFLIWLLAGFDQYETVRKSKESTTARTTYARWGGRPLHRSIFVQDKEGFFWMEGPLSPSGKPHGEWKNGGTGVGPMEAREWFWYGDQITEGEWHLRNK